MDHVVIADDHYFAGVNLLACAAATRLAQLVHLGKAVLVLAHASMVPAPTRPVCALVMLASRDQRTSPLLPLMVPICSLTICVLVSQNETWFSS